MKSNEEKEEKTGILGNILGIIIVVALIYGYSVAKTQLFVWFNNNSVSTQDSLSRKMGEDISKDYVSLKQMMSLSKEKQQELKFCIGKAYIREAKKKGCNFMYNGLITSKAAYQKELKQCLESVDFITVLKDIFVCKTKFIKPKQQEKK